MTIPKMIRMGLAVAVMATTAMVSANAMAATEKDKIQQATMPSLKTLAQQDVIMQELLKSNTEQASWTHKQIMEYGKEWRQQVEAKSGTLLEQVDGNGASQALKKAQADSQGEYVRLAVANAQGIYVAETSPAKEFRNVNRELWRQTYTVDGQYIGRAHTDRETHQRMTLVAVSITGADHKPVGVLIAWVNVDHLPSAHQ